MTTTASPRAAVILAAGKGTRMKTDMPKVMHAVGGRPMIDWSIALATETGCTRLVAVVHPSQDGLIGHFAATHPDVAIVYQDPPQGTGHAVRCAEPALADFAGDLVVLYGDSPLIPAQAILDLFRVLKDGATIGVLGFEAQDPGNYGRLITSAGGELEAIVEAREASLEQRRVRLCNSGVMAGSASTMFRLLKNVTNDNKKQEYYLTDLVALARGEGERCKAVTAREDDLIGCDSKGDLAAAEAIFQARKRLNAMAEGVTLVAPETVFFAHDTEIGAGAHIEPHVVFGPGVRVAPGARIRAFCHLEGCTIGSGAEVGPFARIRPGSVLEESVRIGNFVEVKKTRLGAGAKANHLAYLGDGDVGAGANIGAGTIFCNYDGFGKFETRIGAGAFIGSNSSLVAPVSVGDGAYVGSGSVITKDVAPGALGIARARQSDYAEWAVTFRARRADDTSGTKLRGE